MKIAILGLGTVGYGVYDIISKCELMDVEIVKIFDRDLSKAPLVANSTITLDYNEIINDSTIEVIIETMGASDFSYQCIKKALKNKKHVITANKEVIAMHLEELSKLKDDNNVSLYFEAAVGGGIEIISSLQMLVKTNQIREIVGIINGTTNFILSKVFKDNMSFDEALVLAKKLGYAEKDPTADLEGLDMVRKISILASIAANGTIDLNDIYHYGISNLSEIDIDFIKKQNCVLKYIASSEIENEKVSLQVEPVIYPLNHLFSSVDNEFNIVLINCSNYGELAFYGKGAGRYPSANAIVNDLIRIKEKNINPSFKNLKQLKIRPRKTMNHYYLNLKAGKSIDQSLIRYQADNLIITKRISAHVFEQIVDDLNFYARFNN